MLYAITNKKEYAERFQNDRDMDQFIMHVHKHVTKEEYKDLCNEERSSVLEIHELSTVMSDERISKNIQDVQVLMTYWEWQLTKEPVILMDDEEWWEDMPFPLIFKDKYIKALEALQYITYYKIMKGPYLSEYLLQKLFGSTSIEDDYSAPSISYDELSIFINTVLDTLKK